MEKLTQQSLNTVDRKRKPKVCAICKCDANDADPVVPAKRIRWTYMNAATICPETSLLVLKGKVCSYCNKAFLNYMLGRGRRV